VRAAQRMSAIRVGAIVLAAGSSARMGARDKLLMAWAGAPLVQRAVSAAHDGGIQDIIVVVQQRNGEVGQTLRDLSVHIVENANHAQGIASSIRAGIGAVAPACAGALVLLADMPLIAARHIVQLTAAFVAAKSNSAIVVPFYRGRRGNPVLWGRDHFSELMHLSGDVGARALLQSLGACMVGVESPDDAVLVDVDSPQDWARLQAAATS
jgi:molybdenum cofactor cytidylyltransferase